MSGHGEQQAMDLSVPAAESTYNNTQVSGTINTVRSELQVVISGTSRPMTHWNPFTVNNSITSLIGDYDEIRVLPSGDLHVTCKDPRQVQLLLECDQLGDSTPIPVKTFLHNIRPFGSRAVISGVPLELSEYDLIECLYSYGVTFVKRLKKRSDEGLIDSMSVLLCFKSTVVPDFVTIYYLRLRTKPYNPPPKRCFKCNRYGHSKENCRGKACCSKCGGRDHEYDKCENAKKCVNCNGNHSAAYAGCKVYKNEATIQLIKERGNMSYFSAKAALQARSFNGSFEAFNQPNAVSAAAPALRLYSEAPISPFERQTRATETRPPPSVIHSSRTPVYPVPNDADTLPTSTFSTFETPPLSASTPSATVPAIDPAASFQSILSAIHPLLFFGFLAEVIQHAFYAKSAKEGPVFDIVSAAARNWLGYPLDAKSMKDLVKSLPK